MRKLTAIILIALCGIIFHSCKPAPLLTLVGGDENLAFTSKGGTQTLKFMSTYDWIAYAADSWASVSAKSGSAGEISLMVSVEPSRLATDRSTSIVIRSEGLRISVKLVQDANVLNVLTSDVVIGSQEQDFEVPVEADNSLIVSADCDWLSFVKTKADTRSYVIHARQNATYDDRSAELTFLEPESKTKRTITVLQKATPALMLSREECTVDFLEASFVLTTQSTEAFEVLVPEEAGWLSVIKTKALVENSFLLQIQENKTSGDRKAVLTFRSENLERNFTVIQKAMPTDPFIIPVGGETSVPVESAGGLISFAVSTNIDELVADISVPWITLDDIKSLSFNAEENLEFFARTADVTIRNADSSVSLTFTLTQPPQPFSTYWFNGLSGSVKVPAFTGEGMCGVVIWSENDAPVAYEPGLVHEYGSKGSLTIMVRNEKSFSLDSISQNMDIDLRDVLR